MLGIFGRFNPSYEEAARDLGASDRTTFWRIVFPLIASSVIGVGLLGFTLSYDEFTRTSLVSGQYNTLPLEIFGMTTNVTSPALYALGTLLRNNGAETVNIGSLDYVMDRDNPLFSRLEGFLAT